MSERVVGKSTKGPRKTVRKGPVLSVRVHGKIQQRGLKDCGT